MSSALFRLPFEQPIYELQDQIDELEKGEPLSTEESERLRALRRELTETTKGV